MRDWQVVGMGNCWMEDRERVRRGATDEMVEMWRKKKYKREGKGKRRRWGTGDSWGWERSCVERGRDIAGMWQSLRERRNEGIKKRCKGWGKKLRNKVVKIAGDGDRV